MATVFKPSYSQVDPATGLRRRWKGKTWYARWFDHVRKTWRKRKGYADKGLTLQLACRLERESAAALEGFGPDPAPGGADLDGWIGKYISSIKAKGRSAKHLALLRRDIERSCEGCSWHEVRHMNHSDFADWLSGRRESADGPGIAARTWNRLVTSMRSFGTWLLAEGAIARNPFLQTPLLNIETDRRRIRRSVSNTEIQSLIAVTNESQETWRGLVGRDRAWLYTVALCTGFRVQELASLKPSSFDLTDPTRPFVRLRAIRSKRREADLQPLPAWICDGLREYLQVRPSDEPIWPGLWWTRAAKMLARDLVAAKVPIRDETGRVFDFHALRGQFISQLALSGVGPVVLRDLARHSTIDLTLRVYADLGLDAKAEAVGRLTQVIPTVSPLCHGEKQKVSNREQ